MPPAEQCWPSSSHDTPYQISSPTFATEPSRSGLGADGFNKQPLIPPGRAKLYTTIGTHGVRLTGQDQTMGALAERLVYFLKRPVVDSTGLTAKYNFTLTFLPDGVRVPPSADPLPNVY